MDRVNSDDFYSPGYCEYLVDGYASGKIIALRTVSVILGVILCAFLFAMLSFVPQIFFIWLVLLVFVEIVVFRLTKREFEYTVSSGEMTVEIIYGRRWRKKLLSVRVSDAERIFPVDLLSDLQKSVLKADKLVLACRQDSKYMYCLYIKDKSIKNANTAIVFSSCKRLIDTLKFYNRSSVVERK